jgi:hypothetical protein
MPARTTADGLRADDMETPSHLDVPAFLRRQDG